MRKLLALLLVTCPGIAGDIVELKDDLAPFQSRFDAGKARLRFVAVVSPT